MMDIEPSSLATTKDRGLGHAPKKLLYFYVLIMLFRAIFRARLSDIAIVSSYNGIVQ